MPAKHGTITFTAGPCRLSCAWQGLPLWNYCGNKAGKRKSKSLWGFVVVCLAAPAPVAAGLCKALVAMALQWWENRAHERSLGVLMGMLSPHKCLGYAHWALLLEKGVCWLAGGMLCQQ